MRWYRVRRENEEAESRVFLRCMFCPAEHEHEAWTAQPPSRPFWKQKHPFWTKSLVRLVDHMQGQHHDQRDFVSLYDFRIQTMDWVLDYYRYHHRPVFILGPTRSNFEPGRIFNITS